ncbi:MAG: AmmeMemoRadiSam system protein A [Chloroflexi bacterium]|nr:AmmeMemoRadiSam system protein A [Chloroflexota bacterium]
MSGIVFGCAVPHPPIIIPEIGRGELRRVEATTKALKELARDMAGATPQSIVIISPHGPTQQRGMGIVAAPSFEGDFSHFGVSSVALSFQNDLPLATAIKEEAEAAGVPVVLISEGRFAYSADWGVLVPMYYLREGLPDLPVVPLTFSWLSYEKHFLFGQAIQKAAERTGKRVALVASGDLSHRLLPSAPAGYDPMGKVFDQKVVEAMEKADAQTLMHLEGELVERAGECGLRSFIILMGSLDGLRVKSRLLSYEGPFGVGYMVAAYTVDGKEIAGQGDQNEQQGQPTPGGASGAVTVHPLVRLAKQAVEAYVREGRVIPPPKGLTPEMQERAGVFVSLKKFGELRGCIGTFEPTQPNVAMEIIHNAISSATRDPRFLPVEPAELGDVVYSVDVLTKPERVKGLQELDPKRYGVIVQAGRRRGLLLPDLEGVNTVEQQLDIARRKAGIAAAEPVQLYRFEVKRYH